MKYQGSKKRIANEIIQSILSNSKYNNETIFYDVFCGSCNLIEKVLLNIDIDEYVIEAMRVIRDNPAILPKNNKEFTEEDYNEIKKNKDKYPKWLVGYAGYALSWGSQFFGGYRRDNIGKRDYVKEEYNSALKQSKLISGVTLISSHYKTIKYNKNSIIYCDPPYCNTAKYRIPFNHDEFFEYCIDMTKRGYQIFTSEYSIPEKYKNHFKLIWKKEIKTFLTKNNSNRVEKLFKVV